MKNKPFFLGSFLEEIIAFRLISEYRKMILFNSFSLGGAGIMYLLIGFIPVKIPILSIIAIAATHAIMAFNVGGFYKCAIFVARFVRKFYYLLR